LLCSAGREERPGLYGRLYAELFRKVPDHPSLKVDTALAINSLRGQMLFLRRFLNSDATLMEIGSGTCMLSLEAAKHVKKVYAIDVEDQTSKSARKPDNFQLIIYEGIDIPLPEGSVNIAYSNQMIEHLHPDDALALTQDIYRVLASGRHLCLLITKQAVGPLGRFQELRQRGYMLSFERIHAHGAEQSLARSRIRESLGVPGPPVSLHEVSVVCCVRVRSGSSFAAAPPQETTGGRIAVSCPFGCEVG